eukprot:1185363-Prorocentrum_minimum.AAC.4
MAAWRFRPTRHEKISTMLNHESVIPVLPIEKFLPCQSAFVNRMARTFLSYSARLTAKIHPPMVFRYFSQTSKISILNLDFEFLTTRCGQATWILVDNGDRDELVTICQLIWKYRTVTERRHPMARNSRREEGIIHVPPKAGVFRLLV